MDIEITNQGFGNQEVVSTLNTLVTHIHITEWEIKSSNIRPPDTSVKFL